MTTPAPPEKRGRGRPRRTIKAPWPIPQDRDPAYLTTLRRALKEANLDQLISMLWRNLPQPPARMYSVLHHIFDQAHTEGVSLDPHPHDLRAYHAFLTQAASYKPGGEAAPNTVRGRIAALSSVYDAIIHTGALDWNPLDTYERPPIEQAHLRVPPRPVIDRLHSFSRHLRKQHPDDARLAALPAALVLIDEHALQVSELLALTWGHYDPHAKTLTRPYAITRLSRRATAAMRTLHLRAGGSELDPGGVSSFARVFPWESPVDFTTTLKQACAHAATPTLTPKLLRLAALRDHDLTPEQAGFSATNGEREMQRSKSRLKKGRKPSWVQENEAQAEQSREKVQALVQQVEGALRPQAETSN